MPTWKLPSNHPAPSNELLAFIAAINASALFREAAPIAIARAPGRLDLMGGIADYSGALVLELPLACATWVAAQRTTTPEIVVQSLDQQATHGHPKVRLPLADLLVADQLIDEYSARHILTSNTQQAWAAYVIGTLITLAHAKRLHIPYGLHILVHSSIPAGKGVSSSAALEVASMLAIAALFQQPLQGRELALLCQRTENLVVGAPCGIMDQMTVACGLADQLLALRCQPAELEPLVQLPAELAVWGIDSGIRHAVGSSDYGTVRAAASIGYRIIAEQVGLKVMSTQLGQIAIDDPEWGGYLANITPATWERFFREHVPEQIDGASFLARYGGITDQVVTIEPSKIYPARAATAHPIYEQQRVRLFRALVQAGASSEEERQLLGELMEQSHASYSACGLGSRGTDRLVDLVRNAGPHNGVYGAKITGGGSGGTVAVLGRCDAAPTLATIAQRYHAETGRNAMVLSSSSPGAMAHGVVWLKREW
jgi:L-arabinokinase